MKIPNLLAFRGCPEFTTDGCSGYMTYLWTRCFGYGPPWNSDCIVHDWYYWSGGSPLLVDRRRTRREADANLFANISDRGYPIWAWLCWIGVRLGGSQYLPFSWRWRYRERYIDVLRELFA